MNDVVETPDETTPDTQETTATPTEPHETQQPLNEPETKQPDNEEPEAQPKPSETEHPEWFMKDKYTSIEEQAKSAFELQKKMGKYWGSPKDDYSLEGIEGITKDDPLLANLIPGIKELGISQDGFQHLVKQYQDANVKMMKKFEDELKEELTVKDATTYQACDKWMTENLTAEEKKQIQNNWLMTPADFKLFNQMRLKAAPSTNVPSSSDSGVRFESSKEVENDKIKYRKEVNQKMRVPDKNYENELAQRFRDARSRELHSKS